MIINTGQRTDIPAFYSEWFMNRIKEGFCYVRNPYFPKQVTKYILDPSVVDVLVFCTKNPTPMLKYMDNLKKFRMFWFVTITPYGNDIEVNVGDKRQIIESFKKLSLIIGKEKIHLRYDPIIINDEWNVEKHIKAFRRLLTLLRGYTNSVTISFLDIFDKVKKNASDLKAPTKSEEESLIKAFIPIAKENKMTLRLCLEDSNYKKYGITTNGCMTKEVIEDALSITLNKNIKGYRKGCNCLITNDIGQYNTCLHNCRYCYANYSYDLVKRNYKNHDKNSPLLIGNIEDGDIIKEAKMESYINDIHTLFN